MTFLRVGGGVPALRGEWEDCLVVDGACGQGTTRPCCASSRRVGGAGMIVFLKARDTPATVAGCGVILLRPVVDVAVVSE